MSRFLDVVFFSSIGASLGICLIFDFHLRFIMENSIFFSFFCFPVSRLNCCLDFFAIKSQLKAQKLSLTNRLSAFISGYNLITMEKFLALVEQKQEIEIDENKLKHMISIISIWDFFGISQSQYFLLSVKKKLKCLRNITLIMY